MRWVALLAVALGVTGCMGGGDDDLVSRDALVAAFAAAGEPLELRADVARAEFGFFVEGLSDIDATYVPEGTGEDGAGAFVVLLLEEADPQAEKAAESVEPAPPDPRLPQLNPVYEKNVLLLAFGVGASRRDRLVAIVESL